MRQAGVGRPCDGAMAQNEERRRSGAKNLHGFVVRLRGCGGNRCSSLGVATERIPVGAQRKCATRVVTIPRDEG